jgi:cytochrome b6-f complex iron-sulfur subunit
VEPQGTVLSQDGSRRTFLTKSVNALIGLWVACAGILGGAAGFRYLWPTIKTAGSVREEEVSFPMSELSEGAMKRVIIKGKPVGVILSDGKLHALSLICTHLGCIVSWQSDQMRFLCPCHASIFDVNGTVLGGPAPRPLPSYEAKVSGNTVIVG